MVDKLQGLQYPIEFVDRFTPVLLDALDGIEAVKREVRALGQSSKDLADLKTTLQEVATAARKVGSSQKSHLTASERLLENATERRKEENRAADALQRQKAAAEEVAKSSREISKAHRDQAQAASNLASAQAAAARNTIAQHRATNAAQREAIRLTEKHGTTLVQLARTFVLYRIFRDTIIGLRDAFLGGIGFNDEIKNATIGIAALLSTSAEVRDAWGQNVDAATQFQLAIGLAKDQIKELRKEALATPAIFRDLLRAFQEAIGPGLAAGLDPDQIRKFATQVSLAARAIGVPQRQLAEEIRSIFSGAISSRNTRIATVLQITNEDIKQWREAGTLFDNLTSRFAAFSAAAEDSSRTLAGLWARFSDGAQEALRAGLEPVYERLLRVVEAAKSNTLSDTFEVNPAIVNTISQIGDAIIRAIDVAQGFGESIGGERVLRGVINIAEGLAKIVEVLGAAGTGFGVTFDTATRLLNVVVEIVDFFARLGGALDTNLLARFLGVMLGVQASLKIAVFLASNMLGIWRLISGKVLLDAVTRIRLIAANTGATQRISVLLLSTWVNMRLVMTQLAAATTFWQRTAIVTTTVLQGMRTVVIGLSRALVVLGVSIAGLLAFNALFTLFDSFSGAGADNIDKMTTAVEETKAALIPATRTTELFAEAWDSVQKSVSKARTDLQRALAIASADGPEARGIAGTITDAQIKLTEEILALEKEYKELQDARISEQERYNKLLTEARGVFGERTDEVARLLPLLEQQVKTQTELLQVQNKIKAAEAIGFPNNQTTLGTLNDELKLAQTNFDAASAALNDFRNSIVRAEAEQFASLFSSALGPFNEESIRKAVGAVAPAIDGYIDKVKQAAAADATATGILDQQNRSLEKQAQIRKEISGALLELQVRTQAADRSGVLARETEEIERQSTAISRRIAALKGGKEEASINADLLNDLDEIESKYEAIFQNLNSEAEQFRKAFELAQTALEPKQLESFRSFIQTLTAALSGTRNAQEARKALEIAEAQEKALQKQATAQAKISDKLLEIKTRAEEANRIEDIAEETREIERQSRALERTIGALRDGSDQALVDANLANEIDEIESKYDKLFRKLDDESGRFKKAFEAAQGVLEPAKLEDFRKFLDDLLKGLEGSQAALEIQKALALVEAQEKALRDSAKASRDLSDNTATFARFLNTAVQDTLRLRNDIQAAAAALTLDAVSFDSLAADLAGDEALSERLRTEGELFELQLRRGDIARTYTSIISEIAKREEDIKKSKLEQTQVDALLIGLDEERLLAAQRLGGEQAALTQQIEQQEKLLERARAREQNPATAGLFDAGASLNQGIADRSREFFTALGSGAASTVTDVLFDALDPNNGQEIGERLLGFARGVGSVLLRGLMEELAGLFFRSIATALVPALAIELTNAGAAAAIRSTSALTLITASEIELANASAAAALRFASAAASAATGGVLGAVGGLAKGGPVPRGFAKGGAAFPRPSYIAASDTVPAWLTPGEWVADLRTIKRYSMGFLEALRHGWVDPEAVRDLMGSRRRSASRVRKSVGLRGYASGGPVDQIGQLAGATTPRSRNASSVAVMEPSAEMLEAMLAKGGRALRTWLARNKPFIRSLAIN